MGVGGLPVMLEIDYEKCTACGDCVSKCPGQAVSMVGGKPMLARPDNCDYCTDCEGFCPSGAIRAPFEIVMADPGFTGKFTGLMPAIVVMSATSLMTVFAY